MIHYFLILNSTIFDY